MQQTIQAISLQQAIEKAPAIAATTPAPTIKSPNYKFTSTEEIIGHMTQMGYILTDAKQSKTNVDLRKNWGTHIIKFQHPELYVSAEGGLIEARPEIVMVNSHDGVRPIQFEMGIFRLVCANGLMVKSADLGGFRERHTKFTFQEVKDLIDSKLDMLPKTMEAINRWNMREMSPKERFAFATEALALRMNTDRKPEQYELLSILQPKRTQDEGNNLWKVFNVCEENLIKGGFDLNERTARAITNPITDLTLNQDLWELAEQYAK
jgi:hypothetical protein